MKRKFQKLLALIMAMAMCLSLLQTTAFAVEAQAEVAEDESVVAVTNDESADEAEVAEPETKDDEDLNELTKDNHDHTYSTDPKYWEFSTGGNKLPLSYTKIKDTGNTVKEGQVLKVKDSLGTPQKVTVTYKCTKCGEAYTAPADVKVESLSITDPDVSTAGTASITVVATLTRGLQMGEANGYGEQELRVSANYSTASSTSGYCTHTVQNLYIGGKWYFEVKDVDNIKTTTVKDGNTEYTVLAQADGTAKTTNASAKDPRTTNTSTGVVNENVTLLDHSKPGYYTVVKHCTQNCGLTVAPNKEITVVATGHEWEIRYDDAKKAQITYTANNRLSKPTSFTPTPGTSGSSTQLNKAIDIANDSAAYLDPNLTDKEKEAALIEIAATAYAYKFEWVTKDGSNDVSGYKYTTTCKLGNCSAADKDYVWTSAAVNNPEVPLCGSATSQYGYFVANVEGVEIYKVANATKDPVIPADKHDWSADTKTLENDKIYANVDANGNVLGWVKSYAATCSKDGKTYTGRVCKNCGAVLNAQSTKIEKSTAAHSNLVVEKEKTTPATCGVDGKTETTYKCLDCGKSGMNSKGVVGSDITVIPATGKHAVAVNGTSYSAAVNKAYNDAVKDVKSARGITTALTQTEVKNGVFSAYAGYDCKAGYPEFFVCKECGKVISGGVAYDEVEDILTAVTKAHSYEVVVNWKTETAKNAKCDKAFATEATVKNAYEVKEKCTVCGTTRDVSLKDKSNNAVTFTQTDKHALYKAIITAYKDSDVKIPFTYTETNSTPATCWADGYSYRTYICPDCKSEKLASDVKIVLKDFHTTGETKVVKEIKKAGTTKDDKFTVVYECSKCGTTGGTGTFRDTTIVAETTTKPDTTDQNKQVWAGNTFDAADKPVYSKKVGFAATCVSGAGYYWVASFGGKTAQSEKTYTTNTKDPTNHLNIVSANNAVAATCVKAGKTADKICADCGAVVEAGTVVAATGKHAYVQTASKAATYTADGSITYTCSDCGDVVVEKVAKKTLAKGTIKSLTAKKGKKVVVKFKKVTGAKKYRVAWSYNGTKWTLNDTTKTSITLKNLKAGKKLRVKVRAIAGNNKGDYSAIKKVTVKK